MQKDTEIILCGDICPTKDIDALFLKNEAEALFGGLSTHFAKANVLMGNLEFSLANEGGPIEKNGPVYQRPGKFIQAFRSAGFDLLGLANNHIGDFGEDGVTSAIRCCCEAGIKTVGAGSNIEDAKKPVFLEVNGWTLGVMAFTEHHFGIATEHGAGANLLDVYYSFEQIQEVSKKCDYLIILYHGGIGSVPYLYPSPMLQKKCRKMIESGAQLVLCQHSHCIGSQEDYRNAKILYGQGNTVFGYRANNKRWNSSLVVKVHLSEKGFPSARIEYLPVSAYENRGIDLCSAKQSEEILSGFWSRSMKITDEEFVKKSWATFCKQNQASYLPILFGKGRYFRAANIRLKNRLIRLFVSRKKKLTVMSLLRCESSYEVMMNCLENESNSIQ